MKLNIANPLTGLQKIVEVEDQTKLLPFFERRMGHEVAGDSLGDEFKGYIFRITGGNDKQGFPMMQGVLLNHRARLLFREGMKCFRPRRNGYRKRKSVRGCIVGPDLSVLCLSITKKGDQDVAGLTDEVRPRRLGPKRANRIRKLFGLTKEDDVTKFVVRRKIEGKNFWKAPRVQRLLTPKKLCRLRRDKKLDTLRKERIVAIEEEYEKMINTWRQDQREKRAAELVKKAKKAPKGITKPEAKKVIVAPKAKTEAEAKAKSAQKAKK